MNRTQFEHKLMMEVFNFLTKKKTKFPKYIDVNRMYLKALEYFKSREHFEQCDILNQIYQVK